MSKIPGRSRHREPHAQLKRRFRRSVQPRLPLLSREFAAAALSDADGDLPRRLIDDVLIVVSEFVTASCVSGARTVELGIEIGDGAVTVTVRDDRERTTGPEHRINDTREMLLDALTADRRSFADGDGVVNVARLLVTAA